MRKTNNKTRRLKKQTLTKKKKFLKDVKRRGLWAASIRRTRKQSKKVIKK